MVELLNLIEVALERIRPSGARRDTILVGRPLALVEDLVILAVEDVDGRRPGNPLGGWDHVLVGPGAPPVAVCVPAAVPAR